MGKAEEEECFVDIRFARGEVEGLLTFSNSLNTEFSQFLTLERYVLEGSLPAHCPKFVGRAHCISVPALVHHPALTTRSTSHVDGAGS